MNQIHTMLVGGLIGIASTLGGLSLAKADCGLDDLPHASFPGVDHAVDVWGSREQALAGSELCAVDGGFYETPSEEWVSYCNTAFELDTCEELSNTIDCAGMSADACDVAMGDVYEGCLVLAGMTGAVKP